MDKYERQLLIEQYTKLINQLKAEDAAEAQALRDSVTPEYTYSIELTDDTFDKLYDPSVLFYKISGKCMNIDALEAVGYSSRDFHEGSMKYLFNKATGKIIGSFSGGTVFINNPFGSKRNLLRDYAAEAFEMVNAFLARYPEGGDITHIIEAHKADKKEN